MASASQTQVAMDPRHSRMAAAAMVATMSTTHAVAASAPASTQAARAATVPIRPPFAAASIDAAGASAARGGRVGGGLDAHGS